MRVVHWNTSHCAHLLINMTHSVFMHKTHSMEVDWIGFFLFTICHHFHQYRCNWFASINYNWSALICVRIQIHCKVICFSSLFLLSLLSPSLSARCGCFSIKRLGIVVVFGIIRIEFIYITRYMEGMNEVIARIHHKYACFWINRIKSMAL